MAIHPSGTVTTPREDLKGSFNKGSLDFEPSCLLWLRPLKMMKSKGVLEVLPPQSLLDMPDNLDRNRDGSYNFAEFEREEINFKTKARGLNMAYDEEDAADYEDDYSYRRAITQMLWGRVMRRMEYRALQLVNTTTFATGTRGHSASNSWATSSSGDPGLDAKKAKKGMWDLCGAIPNAMCTTWSNIWNAWSCDALWKNSKYTRDPGADPDLKVLAAAMGLKYVIPWGGKYNSAKEGQTAALADMANPDYAFFCRVAESDAKDEACVGRILYHDKYGGMGSVKEILHPLNDQEIQRVFQKTQEKIFWNDLGWLVLNVD